MNEKTNEVFRFSTMRIMYYHHVIDKVYELAKYYFSALTSTSFPYFVILGLTL